MTKETQNQALQNHENTTDGFTLSLKFEVDKYNPDGNVIGTKFEVEDFHFPSGSFGFFHQPSEQKKKFYQLSELLKITPPENEQEIGKFLKQLNVIEDKRSIFGQYTTFSYKGIRSIFGREEEPDTSFFNGTWHEKEPLVAVLVAILEGETGTHQSARRLINQMVPNHFGSDSLDLVVEQVITAKTTNAKKQAEIDTRKENGERMTLTEEERLLKSIWGLVRAAQPKSAIDVSTVRVILSESLGKFKFDEYDYTISDSVAEIFLNRKETQIIINHVRELREQFPPSSSEKLAFALSILHRNILTEDESLSLRKRIYETNMNISKLSHKEIVYILSSEVEMLSRTEIPTGDALLTLAELLHAEGFYFVHRKQSVAHDLEAYHGIIKEILGENDEVIDAEFEPCPIHTPQLDENLIIDSEAESQNMDQMVERQLEAENLQEPVELIPDSELKANKNMRDNGIMELPIGDPRLLHRSSFSIDEATLNPSSQISFVPVVNSSRSKLPIFFGGGIVLDGNTHTSPSNSAVNHKHSTHPSTQNVGYISTNTEHTPHTVAVGKPELLKKGGLLKTSSTRTGESHQSSSTTHDHSVKVSRNRFKRSSTYHSSVPIPHDYANTESTSSRMRTKTREKRSQIESSLKGNTNQMGTNISQSLLTALHQFDADGGNNSTLALTSPHVQNNRTSILGDGENDNGGLHLNLPNQPIRSRLNIGDGENGGGGLARKVTQEPKRKAVTIGEDGNGGSGLAISTPYERKQRVIRTGDRGKGGIGIPVNAHHITTRETQVIQDTQSKRSIRKEKVRRTIEEATTDTLHTVKTVESKAVEEIASTSYGEEQISLQPIQLDQQKEALTARKARKLSKLSTTDSEENGTFESRQTDQFVPKTQTQAKTIIQDETPTQEPFKILKRNGKMINAATVEQQWFDPHIYRQVAQSRLRLLSRQQAA